MDVTSDCWTTDESLIASLPGGHALIEWFGSCPGFHDAHLEKIEFGGGNALIVIKAFRMTSNINADGFFVLDRHALITMRMRHVSGLKMYGDTNSIISSLTIRHLPNTPDRAEWPYCNGPSQGDIKVEFDTSIGLCALICSKTLEFEIQPTTIPEAV